MTTSIALTYPRQFHYEHTVYSHGWCALFPFRLDTVTQELRYSVALSASAVADIRFSLPGQRRPAVDALSSRPLSARQRSFLSSAARDILHLDLDLRPFYARVAGDPSFDWIARNHTGRMLRAPRFFEDVVKMILTTNCSWSLTTQMNARLCDHFGRSANGRTAFPAPEAIADSSEAFLRREVRLGYRAPFVLELARRTASGDLDLEAFRRDSAPAAELYRALRRIKGIGEYAAGNLLKLLGRYDYLGLDSWCRAKFYELHHAGSAVDDAVIERYYAPYEKWKGLVMWLDVTRQWYADKFPF